MNTPGSDQADQKSSLLASGKANDSTVGEKDMVKASLKSNASNRTKWISILVLSLSILTLGGLLFATIFTLDSEYSILLDTLLLSGGVISLAGLLWLLFKQSGNDRSVTAHTHSSADEILQVFIEENPEIMFVKNLDSSFALANEKFREIVRDPAESNSRVVHDDDLPGFVASRIHQQDLQVIQSEEPMEFYSRYRRGGQQLHLKTLRFPIYDANKELVAIGGISSDVTDQVRSRHALMENEQLLRTFINSAPDAVFVCAAEGRITLVNEAAEYIFGFDRSEMLDMDLSDLISGFTQEDFHASVLAAQSPDQGSTAQIRQGSGMGKAKADFPVEYTLAAVSTEEGSLIICVLRDISEKADIETQLRQSQKMEAIGKLTGGMAHDFNNLLGIMIGNLALAKRKLDSSDPLTKRLDTALNAAERGADLTKRMLAVAQRQPLQPKPMYLNDMVTELAKMLPQTLGADIEVVLDLKQDIPPVEVDESAVESMLLNLAINAQEAMPQGGKFSISSYAVSKQEVEKALPNIVVANDEYIHLIVEDTGSGMDKEALNRAFEPFFTTKEKGKGLGLAMIYGFVKQSRGHISIESEIGEGTSIHIYLPTCAELNAEQKKPVKKVEVPYLTTKRHTVLLVDDEVDLLEIARTYLEDIGFNVLTAEGGAEALEVLGSHADIELLLTDVVMPKMNGTVLVQKARDIRPDLSVLYASGFPAGTIQEKSGAQLDAPLIHKPYTRDKLAEVVLQTLAERELSV